MPARAGPAEDGTGLMARALIAGLVAKLQFSCRFLAGCHPLPLSSLRASSRLEAFSMLKSKMVFLKTIFGDR